MKERTLKWANPDEYKLRDALYLLINRYEDIHTLKPKLSQRQMDWVNNNRKKIAQTTLQSTFIL